MPYSNSDNPVKIAVYNSSEYIRGEGGQAWGQIIVTVDDKAEQAGNYYLSTELNFQQAVVEIR